MIDGIIKGMRHEEKSKPMKGEKDKKSKKKKKEEEEEGMMKSLMMGLQRVGGWIRARGV